MRIPNAGTVRIMGKDISGWLLLAINADDFEASALHACELVVKRSPNRQSPEEEVNCNLSACADQSL